MFGDWVLGPECCRKVVGLHCLNDLSCCCFYLTLCQSFSENMSASKYRFFLLLWPQSERWETVGCHQKEGRQSGYSQTLNFQLKCCVACCGNQNISQRHTDVSLIFWSSIQRIFISNSWNVVEVSEQMLERDGRERTEEGDGFTKREIWTRYGFKYVLWW